MSTVTAAHRRTTAPLSAARPAATRSTAPDLSRSTPLAEVVGAPHGVRLTRRGRALLMLLLVSLLLVAFAVGRSVSSQAAEVTSVAPVPTRTTVAPGETLWSVAQRIAPRRDPREVVAQIKRLNHLSSSALQAGQLLVLPVAA